MKKKHLVNSEKTSTIPSLHHPTLDVSGTYLLRTFFGQKYL
ncbi:hypothetical protein [uncultured Bacteroides sp.]|nr:hypothetical protein [uncultured Bacteroides sp.]